MRQKTREETGWFLEKCKERGDNELGDLVIDGFSDLVIDGCGNYNGDKICNRNE